MCMYLQCQCDIQWWMIVHLMIFFSIQEFLKKYKIESFCSVFGIPIVILHFTVEMYIPFFVLLFSFLHYAKNTLDIALKAPLLSFNNKRDNHIPLVYCLIKIQPLQSPWQLLGKRWVVRGPWGCMRAVCVCVCVSFSLCHTSPHRHKSFCCVPSEEPVSPLITPTPCPTDPLTANTTMMWCCHLQGKIHTVANGRSSNSLQLMSWILCSCANHRWRKFNVGTVIAICWWTAVWKLFTSQYCFFVSVFGLQPTNCQEVTLKGALTMDRSVNGYEERGKY